VIGAHLITTTDLLERAKLLELTCVELKAKEEDKRTKKKL